MFHHALERLFHRWLSRALWRRQLCPVLHAQAYDKWPSCSSIKGASIRLLTLHDTRNFSCSSLVNIRGGRPWSLLSRAGNPLAMQPKTRKRRDKSLTVCVSYVERPLSYHHRHSLALEYEQGLHVWGTRGRQVVAVPRTRS